MLKRFIPGKNMANSTTMIAEQWLDRLKTDLHDFLRQLVKMMIIGLGKLASWKDMMLRLVGYFTNNLGKMTRLAVLSHLHDSTASMCFEFEL